MKQICRFGLAILIVLGIASDFAAVAENEWMPDPNLRQAVQEALGLPEQIPLTELEMQKLTRLDAGDSEIKNLTGLEHAKNLTWLGLYGNQIRDLSPIDDKHIDNNCENKNFGFF